MGASLPIIDIPFSWTSNKAKRALIKGERNINIRIKDIGSRNRWFEQAVKA